MGGIDQNAPLTLARDPEAEAAARETLAALLSASEDAAGEAFLGAALGGPPGAGEGAVTRCAGRPVLADPLELLVIVDAPLRSAASIGRRVRRAVALAARSRHAAGDADVVAQSAVPLLPSTLRNLELVGAKRLLAGWPGLLADAPDPVTAQPLEREGLRLLVRRGADLLRAEAIADGAPRGHAAREALRIVWEMDLALGAAALLAAGQWLPGLARRDAALRELAAPGPAGRPARGFHARMTWTRFGDVVDRHHEALEARAAGNEPSGATDVRRAVARAADRWLEILRLTEEMRLGVSLPDWTEHAAVLAAERAGEADGVLFEDVFADSAARREVRRAVRRWDAAERLAPAVAALVDWDPGDLPIVPLLLDLPENASREALRQRAIAWGAAV
ncbi:MAG: hypothetical protein ACHQPI_05745 [Thermoanaerobaculia bacterium]